MKFSQVSLLAAAAATVNSATVTVTHHVHQNAVVSVQGLVYVENGQTLTTYTTLGGAPTNAVETAVSTVVALAGAAATANSEEAETPSQGSTAEQTTSSATTSSAEVKTTSTPTATTSSAEVKTTSTPKATTSSSTGSTTTLSPTKSSTSQAATSSASSDDSNLSDFASTILNAHNTKRALHKDTSALSWSDKLASYAQDYADKYDCSGTLTHSGGPYGENLALGYDAAGSVNAWYGEIKDYNWNNPTFSSSTGHFTQVVWKSSTEVGCGIKKCGNSWGSYVICSYNPAGNFLGKFDQNVETLK